MPDSDILISLNSVISDAEKDYGANHIKLDVQTVQVDREHTNENYEKGPEK